MKGMCMDKTTLGSAILERLSYINEGVKQFRSGAVLYSEEPYGILYELNETMLRVVSKLSKSGHMVYAVVSWRYQMTGGVIMEATTYLCLQ